jgi:hypothetical protein
MMEPYQQRVVDEKRDLDARLAKLGAFLLSDEVASLTEDVAALLYAQHRAMTSYSYLLGERVKGFAP